MQLVQVPLLKPVEPIEARLFAGALSKAEWTLRGRRNRLFIVLSGTGRLTLGGHDLQLQAPSLWWLPAGESGTLTFDAGFSEDIDRVMSIVTTKGEAILRLQIFS